MAPKGTVLYWREYILFWIMFVWVAIGAIQLIPTVIQNFQTGNYSSLFVRLFSYLIVLLMLLSREYIKYFIRATFISTILFIFCTYMLFIDKQIISGLGVIYIYSVITSVLMGKNGKKIIITTNFIICFVFGWLIYNGYYDQLFLKPLTIENSLRIALGTYVGTLFATLPISTLINSLFFFLENKKN